MFLEDNERAEWFVAQAISAQDEKLAQTMFLPLAERMVEKMVKEEKIEAEAEVSIVFTTWRIVDVLCHVYTGSLLVIVDF